MVDEEGGGRGRGLMFGNDGAVQLVFGDDVSGQGSGLIGSYDTGVTYGLALAPGVLAQVGHDAGGLNAQDEALEQGVANFVGLGGRAKEFDQAGRDPFFFSRLAA
jgi:hypothetical protein